MDKKTNITKSKAKIITNSRGEKTYDLTKSTDILRDMNRAIIEETKKSGSSIGATEWFMKAIESGQMILPNSSELAMDILHDKDRQTSKAYMGMPGRMFTFLYNPKTKRDLEYFDVTPLIITLPKEKIDIEDNTILAMNLHYLEPDLRAELIDKMLKIAFSRKGEKSPPKGVGYFRIDYDLLKTIRFVYGMPCIRSYSPTRIIGRPIMIPSNEWGNAVELPVQNFVKAKSGKIWVESRILLRKFIRSIASM